MPCSYTIDVDLGVIHLTADGVVTDADLVAMVKAFHADARFHPDMRLLGEFMPTAVNRLSSRGLAEIAETIQFSPTARRALVVRSDLDHGTFRMYESYYSLRSTGSLRVFRDRKGAVDWLNEGWAPEKRVSA